MSILDAAWLSIDRRSARRSMRCWTLREHGKICHDDKMASNEWLKFCFCKVAMWDSKVIMIAVLQSEDYESSIIAK